MSTKNVQYVRSTPIIYMWMILAIIIQDIHTQIPGFCKKTALEEAICIYDTQAVVQFLSIIGFH